MLLKQGYRHVYVSRPFALKHGLIPKSVSRPQEHLGISLITASPLLNLYFISPLRGLFPTRARTVLDGHLRLRRPRQPRSNPHHRRLEDRFPPSHAERGDEFRLCPRQELDGEDGYQVSPLRVSCGWERMLMRWCLGPIRWIRLRSCIWIPGSGFHAMWSCSRMRMER